MEMNNAIKALAALAQDTRLTIFRHLVETGPAGSAAGQIGSTLQLPPATLSFHLRQLTQAGLATATRHGRSIVYAADFNGVNELLAYLMANCCAQDSDCNG
ncbi:MAG: metalloregulator ArsR/SmtB family transcription factor [Gammaproteobacteria bacterium]|nr:metalloregulator ArsR/SmtB family transcription factor [Gammaproteobacteria bacterium]